MYSDIIRQSFKIVYSDTPSHLKDELVRPKFLIPTNENVLWLGKLVLMKNVPWLQLFLHSPSTNKSYS